MSSFEQSIAGINAFLYFFALIAVVGILIVLSMMYNRKMCTLDAPNTYCSELNSERNQRIDEAILLRKIMNKESYGRLHPNHNRSEGFREGFDLKKYNLKPKNWFLVAKNGVCSNDTECKSGKCNLSDKVVGNKRIGACK